MDAVAPRGHAHRFAAAPSYRTQVAIDDPVFLQDCPTSRSMVSRHQGISELSISADRINRSECSAKLEDFALIRPLTFKDTGSIVQSMRQNMDSGAGPIHQFPVKPNDAPHIVEGISAIAPIFHNHIMISYNYKIHGISYFIIHPGLYINNADIIFADTRYCPLAFPALDLKMVS